MLVLTGILFLLLLVNVYQRLKPAQYSAWELAYLASLPESVSPKHAKKPQTYRLFNPNTADSAHLVSAGLSPRQAAALVRYRNAGAAFRQKEDLLKLHWMTEELYAKLQVAIPHAEREAPQAPSERKMNHKAAVVHFINLNEADSQTLVQIKGIGSYTASKLIRYRTWLGGFCDTAQIREIKGLRREQHDLLIQLQKGVLSPLKRIHLNTATLHELQAHPYIRYKAKVILAYRIQHGPYRNADDLLKTGVLTKEDILKLQAYLDFTP